MQVRHSNSAALSIRCFGGVHQVRRAVLSVISRVIPPFNTSSNLAYMPERTDVNQPHITRNMFGVVATNSNAVMVSAYCRFGVYGSSVMQGDAHE